MTDTRTRASWLVYALGALCAGAIVAAILVVGPASGSQATVTRTARVARGVVQSTVSGSGNLQAASQLNLGFNTGGTVTDIYVTQGQHVVQGQLLATLDPQSAEVTLEQAKAALQSAEANLAKEQETDGEGSTGAGSGSGADTGASAGNASAAEARAAQTIVAATATAAAAPAGATTSTPTPTPAPNTTTNAPSGTAPNATPTNTTPTATSPATKPSTSTPSAGTQGKSKTTTRERAASESSPATTGSTTSTSTSTSKPTISTATREANLASAKAAVRSERLTVQSDEQAVQDTKLYAPEDGTIVSLSGQVGEVVTGSGTTRASSSSASSSSGSGSGSSAAGAGSTSARSTGASSSSSGSAGAASSSSSAFAILSDLSSMQLVVPLSESEIGNVKAGQIATVTVEALEGRKLAAHVSEVATLSTSNSGVVSYDVTFHLDQMTSGLKPGMSATAEVVIKQAEGVNVPTSAISADTVTVVRGGKHVRQRVVTGLAGNSSTIVLSGLQAGETVVLPTASTSSGTGATTGTRRGGFGGGGLAGGGLGGGGAVGGGAAFFRGGGG